MLGIIFSQANGFLNFILYVFISLSALIFIYLKHGIKVMLIFFVVFILGLMHGNISLFLHKEEIDAGKNKNICGEIKNITEVKNYNRALVKLENNFYLLAYIKKDYEINPGDKINLTGNLISAQKKRNPGGFDEEKYFLMKKILYKMFPKKINNLGRKNYFYYYLAQIKNKLASVYDFVFDEKEAGILKAMLLGDKSDLDENISELYKTTGIYHVLAISGLHVSIVAVILNFILRFFLDKKTASGILILFLFFYLLMTGESISMMRAFIMFDLFLIANLFYRESDLLTSLGFAGIIILFLNPFSIFDMGFEYSFGSVFGIACFSQKIERGLVLLNLKFNWIKLLLENYFINKFIDFKKYLSASIGAMLISNIITGFYFFYFAPYGFIANLFILPNMAFLILFAFLIGIIGLVNLNLAFFLSWPIVFLLKFFELVCKIFVRLPFAKILVGNINIFFVCLYFVWVYLLIWMLNSFKEKFLRAKKYFLRFSFGFIVLILICVLWPRNPEIIMLDVGQGDCFVIDCKNILVVDGGGKSTQEIGNNTGKNILVPFLDYKAKNFVDAVFVSHSDGDHVIGIIELLENKKVGKVYVSEKNFEDELYKKLIDVAREKNVEINYLRSGDSLANKNFILDCIYPFEKSKPNSNNNASLVLKLNLLGKKILFTGDIEKEAEQEILKYNNLDLKCDILKLAHHGSKTSSSLNFLLKANPEFAIVSTGVNNIYSHPSKEVVERLNKLNLDLINTAESGAVRIKILNDGFEIIRQIKD